MKLLLASLLACALALLALLLVELRIIRDPFPRGGPKLTEVKLPSFRAPPPIRLFPLH